MTSPAVNIISPATRYVGSAVAVLGATAPFENAVVRCSEAGFDGSGAAGLDIGVVVSLTAASWVLVPAAESTHAFISVSVIRLTESALAFAVATVRFAIVSADCCCGGATNVVNCADSADGASSVAAEKRMVVVAWRSFTVTSESLPLSEA